MGWPPGELLEALRLLGLEAFPEGPDLDPHL